MGTENNKKNRDKKLASLLISISLLSTGVLNAVLNSNGIPKYYDKQLEYTFDIKFFSNFFFKEKLALLKTITLDIDSKKDLSWLNNCTDLRELNLRFNTNDFSCLSELDGKNFPNLKDCKIISTDSGIFNKSNFNFLSDCSSLTNLTIENLEVDSNFLETFSNLKYLAIDKFILNEKIDFWRFNELSVLDFKNTNFYDAVMFMDYKDCEFLINNDVVILANGSQNVRHDLIIINEKIERIVSLIELDNTLDDREKFNKILDYVSYFLEYDYEFVREEETERDYDSFYKNGYLYGTFYKDDKNVICGNYAALFQALATRCGLESYFIYSDTHAYNLINLDNKYCFTDPTFLDTADYNCDNQALSASEMISRGYFDKLSWYLKDPNLYYDEAHISKNIPSDIDIEVLTKEPVNIDYKKIAFDSMKVAMIILILKKLNNNKKNVKIKRLKN